MDFALMTMTESQRMALWDNFVLDVFMEGEVWSEDDSTGAVIAACVQPQLAAWS